MIGARTRFRISKKARLAFDPIRGCPMLLYPERGLALNEVAYALVLMCDGQFCVHEMVESLAERFPEAGAERVAQDALGFLTELHARGLLEEAQ